MLQQKLADKDNEMQKEINKRMKAEEQTKELSQKLEKSKKNLSEERKNVEESNKQCQKLMGDLQMKDEKNTTYETEISDLKLSKEELQTENQSLREQV